MNAHLWYTKVMFVCVRICICVYVRAYTHCTAWKDFIAVAHDIYLFRYLYFFFAFTLFLCALPFQLHILACMSTYPAGKPFLCAIFNIFYLKKSQKI